MMSVFVIGRKSTERTLGCHGSPGWFSQSLLELWCPPAGKHVRQRVADAVGEVGRALLDKRRDALARVRRLATGEHAARVGAVGQHRMFGTEQPPHHLASEGNRDGGGVVGDLT